MSGVTDVVFLSFRETNNSPGQIVMVVPGVSEPVVIAEGGDLFEDPIAVFGINGPEIEAPSFCPNDIDGDDDIDVFDLIAFLQAFTPTSDCPANPNCAVADLERDGDIDVFDLITFLQGFKPGRCPGAA